MLVEHVKDIARKKNISTIALHSFEMTKAFYEKLGFSVFAYPMQAKR